MVDASLVISLGAIFLSALASLEKCFSKLHIKKCKSLCFDCEMMNQSTMTRSRGPSIDIKEQPEVQQHSFLFPQTPERGERLERIHEEIRQMVSDVARLSGGRKSPYTLEEIGRAKSETLPRRKNPSI